MSEPAPLHIAVIDHNAFFRTSISAWLRKNVPGIASTRAFSSWGAAVREGLAGVDIILLDTRIGGAPSTMQQVRLLHTAHARTILVAPDRSDSLMGILREANAHGIVFRTDPLSFLATALEQLPSAPPRSRELPSGAGSQAPRLAPHQGRVVQLYATGLTLNQIATTMGISRHTVDTYLKEARTRYEEAGIDIRTKTRLAMHVGGRV